MKLMKYTFKTPVFGSIQCEELFSDTDGRFELSPEQMAQLYDRTPDLDTFLRDRKEDLTDCIPQELEHLILRAEFGDFEEPDEELYLLTHIYVKERLEESDLNHIQEWVRGQMADGWGEGLEQRPWMLESVHRSFTYFDDLSLEFEEDYEMCRVEYYVHSWTYFKFDITLEGVEEVDVPEESSLVASILLPFHTREVIKFSNAYSLRRFLRINGHAQLAEMIEDRCPTPMCTIYIVKSSEEDGKTVVLPKWICESTSFCRLYDSTTEQDLVGNHMPLRTAIFELLK